MSTKAIREALTRLADLDATFSGSTLKQDVHDAWQEVEAIERAAKDFSVNLGDCEPETWTLFCAIANQEP